MEIKKKQPSELNLENVHNELAYSNHFQYKKHLKYQVQMLHHQNIDSNSLGKCWLHYKTNLIESKTIVPSYM